MSVRLAEEFLELIDRLKHYKAILERIIEHDCLGDLERWPYKCELEKVNKRIKELEK